MNTYFNGQRLKKYTIIYSFRHSKMGFNNSLTVDAFTLDEAIEKVKKEVSMVYGTGMLKRFDFKPDPLKNGVVI